MDNQLRQELSTSIAAEIKRHQTELTQNFITMLEGIEDMNGVRNAKRAMGLILKEIQSDHDAEEALSLTLLEAPPSHQHN